MPTARQALMTVMLPLAVAALGGCGGGGQVSPRQQEGFTFAVIGDPHIGALDSAYWGKAGSIAPALLRNAVADINARGVAFTIVIGDISDKGKLWELQKAKEILDALQAPYVPIPGNHDTVQSDDYATFRGVFGLADVKWTWEYRGLRFVTANATNGAYTYPLAVWNHDALQWVQWELAREPNRPTIFVAHHNLWSYGSDVDPREPWGHGVPRNSVELRGILEAAGNVFMTLAGHIHRFRLRQEGITYACVGANLVYPAKLAYYHVRADQIQASAVRLSDDGLVDYVYGLLTPQVMGMVDGPPGAESYTVPIPQIPPATP